MKKMFLLLAMVLLGELVAYSQKPIVSYGIPTRRSVIGRSVAANEVIFVTLDSNRQFLVTRSYGQPGTVLNAIIAAGYTKEITFVSSLAATWILGRNGTDGQLKIYSEQGATDYYVTLNPNSTMTSNANFYLPADEPAATYPLTVTSGGVMGYNDQAVTTTSNVGFGNIVSSGNVTAGATKYLAISTQMMMDSTGWQYSWYRTGSWWYFAREIANTPSNYINLENIRDIKIQNKAGTGLVTVAQGDTSGSTAKWNLLNILGVSMTGSITGDVLVRDSVSFSGGLTRVAKAIAGALVTDTYVVCPKAPGSSTRPVADDFCNIYAKADSVIIMRVAGTTSGLTVYFMRIK